MKKEYTEVTCCNCNHVGEFPKGDKPIGWLHFEEVHMVRSGRRPYEWWFCSRKCAGNLPEIMESSLREKDPMEIPQRKELIQLICDVCEKTRDSDTLNPVFGGSPFPGWITINRNRTGIHDDRATTIHVCGETCLKKLDLQVINTFVQ